MALTFKEYAEAAATTIVYPDAGRNLVYPALKLAGEAGEVAEKIGKLMRDRNYRVGVAEWHSGAIESDNFDHFIETENDLCKELGDVLWYIHALAFELGINLEHIARANIQKLHDRKARGKLQGSGDNR